MSAIELTCQELVELVTDYLEDELPPAERARFEAHLRGCGGCATYVEQIRTTIALTGRVHEDDLSPTTRAGILAAFRDWSGD
jgi:anti-sigma factor RsiW